MIILKHLVNNSWNVGSLAVFKDELADINALNMFAVGRLSFMNLNDLFSKRSILIIGMLQVDISFIKPKDEFKHLTVDHKKIFKHLLTIKTYNHHVDFLYKTHAIPPVSPYSNWMVDVELLSDISKTFVLQHYYINLMEGYRLSKLNKDKPGMEIFSDAFATDVRQTYYSTDLDSDDKISILAATAHALQIECIEQNSTKIKHRTKAISQMNEKMINYQDLNDTTGPSGWTISPNLQPDDPLYDAPDEDVWWGPRGCDDLSHLRDDPNILSHMDVDATPICPIPVEMIDSPTKLIECLSDVYHCSKNATKRRRKWLKPIPTPSLLQTALPLNIRSLRNKQSINQPRFLEQSCPPPMSPTSPSRLTRIVSTEAIQDKYQSLALTKKHLRDRENISNLVISTLNNIYVKATPAGSSTYNQALVTSDNDFHVPAGTDLESCATHLLMQPWTEKLRFLKSAKYPVINLTMFGLDVDIGVAPAYNPTDYIKYLFAKRSGLQRLSLIIKHYLHGRGLNNAYTGGLCSYGIVILTAAMMTHCDCDILTVLDNMSAKKFTVNHAIRPSKNGRWFEVYETRGEPTPLKMVTSMSPLNVASSAFRFRSHVQPALADLKHHLYYPELSHPNFTWRL